MKFASNTLLAVVLAITTTTMTEAWLNPSPSSFVSARKAARTKTATAKAPVVAAASTFALHMTPSNSTSRSTQDVTQEQEATPEKAEAVTDLNVTSFSAEMEDQLDDLNQFDHFRVSSELSPLFTEYANDELEVVPEAQTAKDFVISDQEKDKDSVKMELPTLTDEEFLVSDNIQMDKKNERSKKMTMPKPTVVDDTQDFIISESMEDMKPTMAIDKDFRISDNEVDTNSTKMELPTLTDNEFLVSENIQMDQKNERSKKMTLPKPTVVEDKEEHFVISDNTEDTKPIMAIDKDFRISDTILAGDGEPVQLPELVDNEFIVSENIVSKDRQRSQKVRVNKPHWNVLKNLKDMDMIPPIVIKEEHVQHVMHQAQGAAQALVDFGKVVAHETVDLATEAKASLRTTKIGKDQDMTYEEALYKVAQSATGLWSLMKSFGGFVKETVSNVDVGNLQASVASAVTNLKVPAKKGRVTAAATKVEAAADIDLDQPFFLK